MELARISGDIDAPIDQVWNVIADFPAIDKIIPMEGVTVTTRGSGVGMVRTMNMQGGVTQDEILESLDPENYTYTYSLPDPNLLGIQGYLATVKLTANGPDSTHVDYYSTGEMAEGATLEGVKPVLDGTYQGMIEGTRRLTASAKAG